MNTLEEIVAQNITELRKSQKLTQAELADKINYSDKSVSKWERGDSLPDLKVLKKMADLFGVTVDYFVNENAPLEKSRYSAPKSEKGYQIGVTLLAVSLVWLAATMVYVYTAINSGSYYWQIFVWAVPASLLAFGAFDVKWFQRRFEVFIGSAFCWSFLASVYLQLLELNMWMIFIVGIPAQVALILFEQIRRHR